MKLEGISIPGRRVNIKYRSDIMGSQTVGKDGKININLDNLNSGTYKVEIDDYEGVKGISIDIPIEKVEYEKEDVNEDGVVDTLDLFLMATQYRKESGQAEWNSKYDLNSDLIIDLFDLSIVAKKL